MVPEGTKRPASLPAILATCVPGEATSGKSDKRKEPKEDIKGEQQEAMERRGTDARLWVWRSRLCGRWRRCVRRAERRGEGLADV